MNLSSTCQGCVTIAQVTPKKTTNGVKWYMLDVLTSYISIYVFSKLLQSNENSNRPEKNIPQVDTPKITNYGRISEI